MSIGKNNSNVLILGKNDMDEDYFCRAIASIEEVESEKIEDSIKLIEFKEDIDLM